MPLELDVVGTSAGQAWAKLTFTASQPVGVPPQPGVRARQNGTTLVVCVPAHGAAPIRQASLQLSVPAVPGPAAPGAFPPAEPTEVVALSAMEALSGRCDV